MADRTRNQAAILYVDYPASSVHIVGPNDTLLGTYDVDEIADGRYAASVPSVTHSMSGVYSAIWWDGLDTVARTVYTVGDQPLAGHTLWKVRIAVARRLGVVTFGTVSEAYGSTLSDHMMIGGVDEYAHWYMMLQPPHTDAGRVFRVMHTNGSSMELSDTFSVDPAPGTPFALFEIDPREIDEAIAQGVAAVSEQQRIPVVVSGIEITAGVINVPPYITHITAIYGENNTVLADWRATPGRTVTLSGTGIVTVAGIRSAGIPVWDDSVLECDAGAVIAYAAMVLHAARAGGQAVDVEENLRRQLQAQEEFERAMRRGVGRVPRGMVEVLS